MPNAPLGQRIINENMRTTYITRLYLSMATRQDLATWNLPVRTQRGGCKRSKVCNSRVEHLNPPFMNVARGVLSDGPTQVVFKG
ncbi:hypothetical protein BDN72DRAFT_188736 [Pluteus cervinus]|uniref:Uncharacterized protein n=1 Tax=Pluteus cervinus TaxID=181527 RepID=A0ACD3AIF6_9AGAR|nr:hypothetical protein BDN72DRAFT_188736 [Pluteus cervinus]